MSRRRLSSASFSAGAMASASRKSQPNLYVLASASPTMFGGFDKTEAGKYKKGLFRFKKKDRGYGRRNTMSGSEFLDCKSGPVLGSSGDDFDMLNALNTTSVRRSISGNSFQRQQSASEVEEQLGYMKHTGPGKSRYVFSKMSEGRKTQIVLLDDTTLEILIQPKLFASELLDLVASHFNLKEKEYFGLTFKDEMNQYHWLQLDRKVLEHEFVKRTGSLVLYFAIRFFIESISYLKDSITIELFYCLAKQAIYRERVECNSTIVFELAALALHEAHGDYSDDETSRKHLMKLPVLPTGVLKEHPSISYCEDQVIEQYKKMVGQSRGDVIVQYMSIVEGLPTYGIHYYEVKDKSGIPWLLGLSYKGISLYDNNDKKTPRRVFAWSHLENLYYRDKKFSIEVHDPKRIVHTLSSFNLFEDAIHEPLEDFDELSDAISDPTTQVSVSRRTFGPGNVNVHTWFAATPYLTKSIWSMAVSQHQFYLERKQTRTHSQSQIGRSMSDIVIELCQSPSVFSSTPPLSDGLRSVSSSQCLSSNVLLSTSNASMESGGGEAEVNRAALQETYAALKAKKESIEDKLKLSYEKLKELCMQEADITGELPSEYPQEPGEPLPQIRKRVGTTFPLSPKIINREGQEKDELAQLEIEYELQSKITKAAQKLIQENNDKNIRKTRQLAHQKELQKLKTLELKLEKCKNETAQRIRREEQLYLTPIASPNIRHHHFYDYPDATGIHVMHRHEFPQMDFRRPMNASDIRDADDRRLRHTVSSVTGSSPKQPLQPKSAPSSPIRQFYSRQHPLAALASPTPTRHRRVVGASTNVCMVHQPMCSHGQQGNSALSRVQRQLSNRVLVHTSCMERDKNLYNLRTCQSDCYESGDELNVAPSGDGNHRDHWMYANDSLCSLHKKYRAQIEGCSHLGQEGPGFNRTQAFHDREVWTHASPFMSYENGIYGSADMHYNDSRAGYGTSAALPHVLQTKSPSKDSAINLGCSSSSITSYAAVNRCEPFQMMRGQMPLVHFQTPPFLLSDDSQQSYDGINLSHSETTPSPEPFSSSKNQNFMEVSKPFEMSDFYKYSERLRRQRQREESQSPLRSSSSSSLPQISHTTGAVQQHNMSCGYLSSGLSSDQMVSVEGHIQECGPPQEANFRYQKRCRDLLYQHNHLVGSDSCIDYTQPDYVCARPLTTVQHHSSPYFPQQPAETDIYHQVDRNRSVPES